MTTLNQRLTAQADGTYPTEAAALILTNAIRGTLPDRLAPAITDDPNGRYAYINWDTAIDLARPFSTGERRLIHLAASLATTTHHINANDTFTGLDDTNARIVLDAIAHSLRVRR